MTRRCGTTCVGRGEPGDILLTTNLDNDDGLAVDFCERLAAVGTAHPRVAVYATRGLVLSPDGRYLRETGATRSARSARAGTRR